jgi:thiamine-monophosphate kinase
MTDAPDTPLHGEEAIVSQYLAPLAAGFPGALGLTDDCAVLSPAPGHDLVLKTDPVAAGIHFLPDDAPEDIAWKALAVNVSDLAAKAAVPRAYLMALSFPEAPTREWMRRFAEGLGAAQAAFGIHLAGGDTDRRPGPVTISITVLGEVPAGTMVRRGAARSGDILFVTGTLGTAALGLKLRLDAGLASRFGLSDIEARTAVDKYLRPAPRLALRPALAGYARAAMDLSDGLAKDLGRMCRASGCAAEVQIGRLPLASPVSRALKVYRAILSDIIGGGDDYELLIAVAPEHADTFQAVATRAGEGASPAFGVTRIGCMVGGTATRFIDACGSIFDPERDGWDHF